MARKTNEFLINYKDTNKKLLEMEKQFRLFRKEVSLKRLKNWDTGPNIWMAARVKFDD